MKRTFHIFSLALIFSLLISAVGLPPTPARAAIVWEYVGSAGFSGGSAYGTSLVFNEGVPYVVFSDSYLSHQAVVMKFDGTYWIPVGPAGFSNGYTSNTALFFDNGIPYVVFSENSKANVMKFDALSGNWVYVGPANFSIGWANYLSLAFDSGTPYLAYSNEGASTSEIFVVKFDALSGNWVNVGATGFSGALRSNHSLVFDNGTLYLAYSDWANDEKVSVKKFDGTAWTNIGAAGFSTGPARSLSLVFNNSTPYVGFYDFANGNKASVMKFDEVSGDWLFVGPDGFSAGNASSLSLAFDNDTPYVAFSDGNNGSKANVMKFNGTDWVNVGTAGFSLGAASSTSLAFDNGIPYVAFSDGFEEYAATVMRFAGVVPSAPTINSPASPTNDSTPTISGSAEPGSFVTVELDDLNTIGTVPLCRSILADTLTGDWTCPWPGDSFPGIAEGSFSLYAKAYNGSTYSDYTIIDYVLDLTAPPSPVVTAPPASTSDTTPTISGTAEANSKINVWYRDNSNSLVKICDNVSVDGTGNWSCTSSATLPERTIQLTVKATDAAGNTSSESTHSFTIGLTPPTAPVIMLPTSPTNDSSPTISGAADPGSLVTVKYDDSATSGWVTVCENLPANATTGAWTCNWPGSPFAVIAEGNFSLSAKACNGSTCSSETIANYVLDMTGPHDPVVTSPTSPTNNSRPTISGTADPGVTMYVGYQDSTMSAGVLVCNGFPADPVTGAWTCVWPANFPSIVEGNFKIGTAAYDGVNYSNETFFYYVLDLTAPSAPIVTAPPAHINDTTPTISGTAEANSQVNVWYRDNSNSLVKICNNVPVNGAGNWSCTSSLTLPERLIQLTAKATDAAGNLGSEATRSFTVDLTAPAAPVVTAPVGTINDSTPTISGTAEAGSKVNVWYKNGATWTLVCENVTVNGSGGWSCESSISLPAGNVELKVSATDAAGNQSMDALHSFTLKLSGPTISSIVRAGENPTKASSVDFTVTFSESVKDVDASDFSLYITGSITGASVSGITGSGATYTVTVNAGTKNGTLRLDVPASAGITDLVGNTLGSLPFTSGEEYTIARSNGADTTGVFRPSNGLLYLKNKNDTGFADVAINYGLGGDYPVVGDWDGDGIVTIGIYRNGKFYLRNENSIGFADMVFAFGLPGDQPIAGDWDGDGIDTIGVYRSSTGQFLLRNSNTAGDAEMSFYLGNPGDVGIAGDWDGDGKDTTGVFRPSNGFIFLKNTNDTGYADIALNYGLSGDKPVTGDWDGDGDDTIGVYRGNTFYLRNSNTIGFADIVFSLGNPGDMPIAGDWDGLP